MESATSESLTSYLRPRLHTHVTLLPEVESEDEDPLLASDSPSPPRRSLKKRKIVSEYTSTLVAKEGSLWHGLEWLAIVANIAKELNN